MDSDSSLNSSVVMSDDDEDLGEAIAASLGSGDNDRIEVLRRNVLHVYTDGSGAAGVAPHGLPQNRDKDPEVLSSASSLDDESQLICASFAALEKLTNRHVVGDIMDSLNYFDDSVSFIVLSFLSPVEQASFARTAKQHREIVVESLSCMSIFARRDRNRGVFVMRYIICAQL